MKKTLLFLAVVLMGMSMMAQTTYTKVTSASELEAGANYLIVGYDEALGYCAMSYQKSNNRHAIQVTESGGTISLIPASSASSQTEAYQITLGGAAGAWTFFDELKGGYLYAANSSSNQLKTQTTNNANGQWSIVFEGDGTAVVTAQGENTRNVMRFNENSSNGDPLFNCYLPTSTAGVNVMFYKEGGGTIFPEPTNYPTAFYSSVDRVNVTLDWTDATGGQLPSRYLVVASTGAIQVPTDGTPVANGPLAQNVSYGVETVTFTGLNGGTTYNFAIFPYTNSGANIDYKTDGDYPTATETTEDINLVLYANFETSLAPFTAYDVEGEQAWTTSVYGGIPFAKMSGYAGSAHANEDWLISPNLFANGTYANLYISFDNAFKFDGPALEVYYSLLYDGMSDPNEFDWFPLTDEFNWSPGEYEWAQSGEILFEDIATASRKFYLAFVYRSTDSEASTWEVTNVQIYGTGYDAVAETAEVTVNIYPNPAENSINIVAENDAEVQIMDMAGRTVMTVNAVEGVNAISVADLESGVYFVRMNGAVVKFVKK